jgi:TPP-dependent indolepyruvate ferredoxin oxidoreductase alpha subunit
MLVLAEIGFAMTLLEAVATSIATGTVVAGFLAAAKGVLTGRRGSELTADALTSTFWGGVGGCCCLLYDLLVR